MKFYSIIPILMSAMLLSACGGSSGGDEDGDDKSSSSTPEVKPTPEVTPSPEVKPPPEETQAPEINKPPPEVKPPPVIITELEGKWTHEMTGNHARYTSSYIFSGNEYDYYSSTDINAGAGVDIYENIGDGFCQEIGVGTDPVPCFVETTEYGTFVIGESFTNSNGVEVTKIDFNREGGDSRVESKQTYLLSQEWLDFGDSNGDNYFDQSYQKQ